MWYKKIIENYVGREINFETECQLEDDSKGVKIVKWDIQEKSKPTVATLNTLWTNKKIEIENTAQKEAEKTTLIEQEKEALAIQSLKDKNILDINGDIIE